MENGKAYIVAYSPVSFLSTLYENIIHSAWILFNQKFCDEFKTILNENFN